MEIGNNIHINCGVVATDADVLTPEALSMTRNMSDDEAHEAKISKSISKRSTVKYGTAAKWSELFDPKGEWLEIEIECGIAQKITCKICRKHEDRIKLSSNFSRSFVQGISGDSLKKDNIWKHLKTDMHTRAANLEKQCCAPLSIDELYKTTPIVRAFASVSDNQKEQVLKLFEIAYMMAKTDTPFIRYEDIVKMEMRHGMDLGSTYHNRKSCADFIKNNSRSLMTDIVRSLQEAMYNSQFIDGATDKENIYLHLPLRTGEVMVLTVLIATVIMMVMSPFPVI